MKPNGDLLKGLSRAGSWTAIALLFFAVGERVTGRYLLEPDYVALAGMLIFVIAVFAGAFARTPGELEAERTKPGRLAQGVAGFLAAVILLLMVAAAAHASIPIWVLRLCFAGVNVLITLITINLLWRRASRTTSKAVVGVIASVVGWLLWLGWR